MKKFFKICAIIFSVFLVVLIVALVAAFVFLKNFKIEKYKPQIIKAAGQALGRTVDFKDIHLTVSLDEGIRLDVSDVSVGENPDFGTDPFLTVAEVKAGLDIRSLINSRQIFVPNIQIRSPRAHVIRNAQGVLNVQTLGAGASGSSSAGQGSSSLVVFPAILIKSFVVENAEIHLTDQSGPDAQTVTVTQLNMTVQNFSLADPFDVSVDGAILSSQPDFQMKGKAQLNLFTQQVKLKDFIVEADGGQVALADLAKLPMMKGVPLPQTLKGQWKATIKEAVVSDKGLDALTADAALTGGEVVAKDIVPGISVEANHVDFSVEKFSLHGTAPAHVTVKAALYQDKTNVDFSGDIVVDLKTMAVGITNGQFQTDLAAWPLEKMRSSLAPLQNVPLPEHLVGNFHVTIKEAQASSAGLKKILLDAQLDGGEVGVDQILPGGGALALHKIDGAVQGFSLDATQPFKVVLKTAYLSDVPNISVDGNVQCDLNQPSVRVKGLTVGFDLDHFSLEQFKALGVVPPGVPFPQTLGGNLQAHVNDLSASLTGLEKMNVDIRWQNGKVAIDEVAPGISVAANSISLDVKGFSLTEPFDVRASLGYESDVPNVSFDGRVAFDPSTQKIRVSSSTVHSDLSKIPWQHIKETVAPLKTVPLPEVLKGTLEVNVKDLAAGPKGLGSVEGVDISLADGEVRLKDVAPGISFAASQITAVIKDFGLGTPFDFDVTLAYLHDAKNINLKGTATYRQENQSVEVKGAVAETDLSTLSMEQLKTSVAALKDVPLPEKLAGQLKIDIAEATAGPQGLAALTSQGSLTGGMVKMKELALPVEGIDTKFTLTQKDFTMDAIQAKLGQGQITAQAAVTDYLTTQNFTFSSEIKGIDLSEILDQQKAPVKAAGLVSGMLKAQGQGADVQSVTGEGAFDVKEAKLKDLNVLKTVLDKISFLPNVSTRVQEKLSDKYKNKLSDADTTINTITTTVKIAEGKIVLDPIAIEADEFIFAGTCNAGFDQTYVLDGSFKIPAELSVSMAEGVSEFQYLYDESGNISLPVHVTGQGAQAPAISVTQTAIDMTKNALRNEGKNQLEKVLNKVLGGGDEGTSTTNEGTSQDGAPAQGSGTTESTESPAATIINTIFDKVLK